MALFQRLKIGGRVLADGADIVGREDLPLVDIAADLADPPVPTGGRGGGGLLGFGLDVGLVVGVGGAGGGGEDLGLGDIGQEEGVGPQVLGGDHPAADAGVGPLGHIGQAVLLPAGVGLEPGKLVHRPPRLEAEAADEVHAGLLREDGQPEGTGGEDHVVGQVGLVHRDDEPLGLHGDQHGGVDDAAVVPLPLSGGEDEEPIAEREERLFVDHRESLPGVVVLSVFPF